VFGGIRSGEDGISVRSPDVLLHGFVPGPPHLEPASATTN
jgi:hypothetical protein